MRLAAVNSALYRAGFSAKQLVSIQADVRWNETFDRVVVVTDDAPNDPEVAAFHAHAVEAAPVQREPPAPREDRDPSDPLEGVMVDPPAPARLPRHLIEALRANGYDI